MSIPSITGSADPRAIFRLADDLSGAGPRARDRVVALFESVPGPRLRRAAQDDDTVIECVDPQDTENEPATMVQRIPV